MKRATTLLGSILIVGLLTSAYLYHRSNAAASSITAIGTAFTENFDGIGNSATAALPSGWRADSANATQTTVYGTAATATTQAAGTTGTGVLNGTSTGAFYNFANGVTASSTERAIGWLGGGSFTSPRQAFLQLTNNTGVTITSLNISYDIEKYRSGSRAWTINFFSGTDGSTWTAQTAGDQAFAPDANNTVISNPPTTISKLVSITGLSIANGANYYLRWSYTGTGGSTNGQGLGIDNFSVTAPASTLQFRSAASGNWNANATWEMSTDGATWVAATQTPSSANDSITIRSPHTVTVTANVAADQLTVDTGGKVRVNNSGITLDIADGTGTDLTVNGTAEVDGNGVISGAGSFVLSSGATLQIGDSNGISAAGATGSVQTATRTFSPGANYEYIFASSAQVTGTGLPATVNSLLVNNSAGVTLTSSTTVNTTLSLILGPVPTGANTLAVASGGAVTRTSGYVIGNLQRTFPAAGSLTFDVGTASASNYSPVTVNATTGTFPANFTVKAIQGAMPGISGANKLARYWTLTNTTVTNADLTFNYLAGDVTGTAANYQFIRKETGGALSILAPTGTPTNTTATINGVTSFSDWTLAEAAAVQSGTIQFDSPTYSVNEGAGTITLNVTRTGGTDGAVGFGFFTTDGTASSVAGADFLGQVGGGSFAAGNATNQTITVTITNDAVYEANEDFTVTLNNPSGGATIGSPAVATVTINDNDTAPTISIDSVSVGEGGGNAVFTVTQSAASGVNTTFQYSTADVSATAGLDYTGATNAPGMITAGNTTTTISIPVLQDALVEGSETFTVTLNTPVNATITGSPGTGTITDDDVCAVFATVYVDDSWVGTAPGTDPDGIGPATSFGCDSFATIQGGVNGVTSGGTVIVRAGTYPESVLINQPLSLQGAQIGQDPNTRFAAFAAGGPPNGPKANPAVESVITAPAVNPGSNVNNTIHVMASNVTIDGFVVDGNNPTLSPVGAVVVGGINTDSRRAIETEDAAGAFFAANNVTVRYNVIQNFAQRGVELVNPSNATPATTGSLITQNLIRNFSTTGVVLAFNAYADVTFNTIVTPALADAGVMVQDYLNVGAPTSITIANNTVTVGQDTIGAIWTNLAYVPTLNINNNTVNAAAGVTGAGDATFGIYLSSLRPGTTASLSGNIVGASGGEFSRGIALWNLGTATTTVSGGTVGKSLKGVSLHDNDPNFGLAGSNSAASMSGVSIDGTGVTAGVGVFVDAAGSTGDTVAMEISGNTSIINTSTAISVVGPNASANVHDNVASIHDNTTAFEVSGAATITKNQIYSNATSLRFATGATATAHFNRIISTTTAIDNPNNLTPNLENNWWGCNAGPGNAGCGAVTGTGADFNPRFILAGSASPSTITPGGSSTVTTDMTKNSDNVVPAGTLPNIPVAYTATNGTMNPTSGTVTNGTDSSIFTSNSTNSAVVTITVDNQSVNVPITVSATNTYTWTPLLGSTNWTLPTNWSPTRAIPSVTDILLVDGSATPAPLITDVPTQTIAAFRLLNSALVTLNASAVAPPQTLTISGGSGSDLTVPALSFLTLDGSNGLTIKLTGPGTLGAIGGGVAAQGGFHRLFGDANGSITFQNGALGTAGPGLTSNMFGTGTVGDGALGSVVFASGSTYSHQAGLSPFGTAGSGPVVTFQTGSLARWFTSSGFQASGRTYADLQVGDAAAAVSVTDGGSGNFQFDNLTIASSSSASSSLTFNGSGASTITIQGNINSTGVGNGTLPDVNLTPGSGGITITKVGGGTLTFGNDGSNGRGLDFEGSGNVATVTNGTTLALSRVLLLGFSNPHTRTLTVNATGNITGSSNGYVVGSLKKNSVPGTFIFPVGTTGAYSPVDLVNSSGGGDLTVAARTPQQPVLTASTSLHRYWTLTKAGSLTTDLTFHYVDADLVGAGNENNYRLVVVESGNATSFPEVCPAGPCVDETANTIKQAGVQTFSDWTAAEPNAPTAVKLNGFTATRAGNEVMLQWQSGYEARNLGYNVYREQDGKRVQITPSLVAGSALIAGRQSRLTAGLSYSWIDELAEVRGQKSEVSKAGVTYWLEDVDLNGTRTLHGPIGIAECGIGNADCKKLGERSRLLGELTNQQTVNSKQQTAISNPKSVQFSGWPAAITTPDPGDPEPDPTETQRTIAGLPGLKIAISRPGWYRISQADVLAAGFNITDANGLQLYRDGRQVAFRLSNSAEQFGPTDYLEFYGEGLSSSTASAQTYYLVKLAEPGKRIELKEKIVGPADRVSPLGFAYTVERQERMTYFSGLLNGDAENFFGQIVSSSPANAAIPVSHLDPTSQAAGTPAQLEVTLQGVTSQSHLVQVRFNGADLGTINFANTEHPSQTLSVPAAIVHDGNNTLELTSLGGAADVSLIDVVRLTYTRDYSADNNAVSFNLGSRQTKRLTGFSNNQIRVVDVSDPYNQLELTPHVSPDGDGFAALIGVDQEVRAPFSRPHELLAFTDGQAATPDAVSLNEPSSWWSHTAGADYLIVTTRALMVNVEPLAQLRRNRGLVVEVIDVEDLYDEFSFGQHQPQAIHDLLQTATSSWTRQPHYVLLAGDASYDPKNYFGQGNNDLVPTKLIDTALMEAASDDWLADFNGDGLADLALGRLPVRTAADTNTMVGKIVSYESAPPDPLRGALLVADTGFEAPNSSLQSLLPSGLPVATINRSSADDATIHSQIVAGLNQGPLVANYIGHGSNGVWTGASLLSSNDAPGLANTTRLSVFTMMTCFNGYFQDAYNDSLSEALLKSQGGAVAVWASTTLTDPTGQNVIDQEFYRLLFGAQPATLGDASRAAKGTTGDADVRRTWTLFGDPAMRLR